MKINIHGNHSGDLSQVLQDKFSFLNKRLKRDTDVNVFVLKNEKRQSFKTKVVIPYFEKDLVVESDSHKSLVKTIDELKDKLKLALNKANSKVEGRGKRRSKFVDNLEINVDEEDEGRPY